MWWLIPVIVILLLAVPVIRALMFKPDKTDRVIPGDEKFDGDKVIENLQKLVRCRTVSYRDGSLEDDAEFEKLISVLPELYPNVFLKADFVFQKPLDKSNDFVRSKILFRFPNRLSAFNPIKIISEAFIRFS